MEYMEPLVSVIITTYKRKPEILKQAVDSVLGQTYQNLELIVVDDNGAGTEFQKYNQLFFESHSDVIYLINEKNSGSQYSRNRGILSSHGEYIALLDDDDYWAVEKIEKQMTYFSKDKNIGLVFCRGYLCDENGTTTGEGYFNEELIFESCIGFEHMLFQDYVGSTSQALIRRDCFYRVGIFDPALPARQDYEMWIRISKEYPLIGCSEHLFYHRMHSGEQISKDVNKAVAGFKYIYQKYKADYKKNKKAKVNILKFIYGNCKTARDYGGYVHYFMCYFFTSPFKAIGRIIRKPIKMMFGRGDAE